VRPLVLVRWDGARGIAVDATVSAYVAGEAVSFNFPVTAGALQPTNHGQANQAGNGFITKLNPAGSELIYSTYLGGSRARTDHPCFYIAIMTAAALESHT
jgi:hypothetical protein